MCECVKSKIT